jgi:glyoxylate reductase
VPSFSCFRSPIQHTLRSHSAHKEWAAISEVAEPIEPKSKNRADFIKESKSGDFDGVVAIYRTFNSVAITGLIDEELVKNLPESVKFIAHNGT